MDKNSINKICRKFGFEIHGPGYIRSLNKASFKEDTFESQKNILGGKCQVIFDIGANIGDVTLKYLDLFPSASIYALNLFPKVFQFFNRDFQR